MTDDTSNWFIDELDHAGPEHLDPGFVSGFDRKQHFDPTRDVDLLRSLGLGPASTLIDFGAGTGTFTVAVAPLCRHVIAVDVSPAMLDAAQAKAARQRLANVEFVRQGLLTYQHQGELADFVFTKNTLHQLPDFWKAVALQRIASVLKPDGVLRLRDLVFSFEAAGADQVLEAWFNVAPQSPSEGYTRSELETHVRTEYSTFSWLLEPMLTHAGFEITQTKYLSPAFAAYTCVKL
jgi:ubiquinone/menaquinone biosynthesis C-methylase UbiE